MVVGNGMMANDFAMRKNDEKHIIFASGVSNSTETSQEAFLREERLLHHIIEAYPDKIIVYFSTCGIYDSTLHNSPYIGNGTSAPQAFSSIYYFSFTASGWTHTQPDTN